MHRFLDKYYKYIRKINRDFEKRWVNKINLFKSSFAQPIITKNYSQKIPEFKTPIENLYLCNIQQVYPWDRGTNYSIELGKKVAKIMLEK